MIDAILISPSDLVRTLAARVRELRLREHLTQAGLAERAGVSLGALKLFERTGKISLKSLAKLAFALRREHDFDRVFEPPAVASLDDLARAPRLPRRGRRR